MFPIESNKNLKKYVSFEVWAKVKAIRLVGENLEINPSRQERTSRLWNITVW